MISRFAPAPTPRWWRNCPVLINENLVDQPSRITIASATMKRSFRPTRPNGHYKAYILGQATVSPKRRWASHITGIPADRIIKLAREIGSVKPAYICQGWGRSVRRTANKVRSRYRHKATDSDRQRRHSWRQQRRTRICLTPLPLNARRSRRIPLKPRHLLLLAGRTPLRAVRNDRPAFGVRGKDKRDVLIKFSMELRWQHPINQHSDINKTHEILSG
ncbi:hypothetical protein KCP77_15030 [Salmonella enterica subsp. enterica]|nr:hypothetical protein KCP77_15030 [Salmonella enterica subsp. enterica]